MAWPELGTFSKVPIDFSYSIVKDQPDANKAKGIPSTYGRKVRFGCDNSVFLFLEKCRNLSTDKQ